MSRAAGVTATICLALAVLRGAQAALINHELLDFLPETRILENFTLTDGYYGSGISLWGDPHRLEQKLRMLLRGEKLNIYFTGGSITGHRGVEPGFSYVDRATAWFDKEFPGNVTVHVKGYGGTTSTWASSCVDTFVDQDADIVFVEYTLNDMSAIMHGGQIEEMMDTQKRRGTERLLRRLLTFDRAPAVIVLHTWAPLVLDDWLKGKPHNDFYSTYEDYTDTLCKYYGVPSLSMRNALHHLMQLGRPGFRHSDFWSEDVLHPVRAGHAFLAYIVLDYITQMIKWTQGLSDQLDHYGAPAKGIPPPMFPNNHHHKSICGRGNALADRAKYHDPGWSWVEDGDKPGFMAEGSIRQLLRLEISQADMPGFADTGYLVRLGVVKSWRPFGKIAVECHEGCACESFVEDLHEAGSRVTMQTMVDFPIRPDNLSFPCNIDIRVSPETTSGGYYVKIMSLAVEPMQVQST